jgi:Outer membrane protein beta-barrel domain
VIFGGRGGVSLSEQNSSVLGVVGLSSPTASFLGGPTVGVRLPLGFSVEGDALFNRQTLNFGQFGGFNLASTHLDSWEFPVMLKFAVGERPIAPVFGAGVSFQHINNLSNSSLLANIPTYVVAGTTSANSYGFVAGAGVRFRTGPVEITPEARFTHWNRSGLAASLLDLLVPNRNQVQVLVGLTF